MHRRPTARFRMDYEIRRGDELLVTGHTAHAFAAATTFRAVRPPAIFLEVIDREMSAAEARLAEAPIEST
jgi:acyl-CoA thioester hydrolase